MMMEYGFNEILLVKFITKFYAFEPNQDLVNEGIRCVGKIISELINQNPHIQNLKRKNMEYIIRTLLGQFSYRFGGIDECLGAFGNFWMKHKLEIQKLTNLLTQQQIRKIISPINNQLTKISFYQSQTRQFHPVSKQQTTNRKLLFLKTIFKIQEPVAAQTKQKRKYSKQKKQNMSSSIGSKSILSARQKTRCDLEESIKTQVDEWTYTLEKTSKTTKRNVGTLAMQENIEMETNELLKLKFEQNDIIDQKEEEENIFLLRYEDFFPFQEIRVQSNQIKKPNRKRDQKK